MRWPSFINQRVRYPDHHAWFVLFSSLDIILTHSILFHFADFGGREVNTIADWVIRRFDIWGAIGLKFICVSIAILACEMVGSRREETGRRLAWVVAALSALPPAWALIQLAFFAITHARGVPTVP